MQHYFNDEESEKLMQEEMQADFADSVIMQELEFEEVPDELMQAFNECVWPTADLIPADVWVTDSSADKQELKR